MKFKIFGKVIVLPSWLKFVCIGVVIVVLFIAGLLTEYREGKSLLKSISATELPGDTDYADVTPTFTGYTPVPTETPTPTEAPSLIRVYIIGEVQKPGVYSIADGSILWDLVELAGGFTTDADPAAVNMAYLLSDHMMMRIPAVGESYASWIVDAGSSSSGGVSNGLVNINTATVSELTTLPGIGDSTAQKIVKYRTSNGKFNSIEEIMNVSGIKESRFSEIKDLITVG